MAMTNLKGEPKQKPQSTMCCPEYEEPAYPYGLQITLCDETLKKLAMDGLPKVGSVVTFTAKAVVTSVSQYEEARPDAEEPGEKFERTVGMQITDMDLGQPAASSSADRLYGA